MLLLTTVAAACGQKQSQVLAEATEEESSGSSPGVTDDEVKVGFIVIDQTNLQATLGFETPDQGDREGAIQTLADHVNANGGIGGRKMVPVIRVFDALTDSAVTEEKLCRAFTEDDQVFAVVLLGMFQDNARPCYAAQETLMLDQTQFPVDHASAAALAPYYYQPSLPEYGEVLAGLTVALGDEEFLTDDTRLGIIGIDNEQNRRVFDEQLLPSLQELGAEPVDTQWVDPTSNATLQAGQNQAVLSFKERDVDRVIIVGGSRLLAFLLSITVPQDYFPAYAVTTFDNPNFVASGTPEAMVGAVGISTLPATDLSPGELAFPEGEGEQRCLDILAEDGHTYEERNNATEAFFYCDAVLLLADALRGAEGGDLTASAFQDGAAALGQVPNASNYRSDHREDFYAGAAGYRPMRFSEECGCFELVGETTEFPR